MSRDDLKDLFSVALGSFTPDPTVGLAATERRRRHQARAKRIAILVTALTLGFGGIAFLYAVGPDRSPDVGGGPGVSNGPMWVASTDANGLRYILQVDPRDGSSHVLYKEGEDSSVIGTQYAWSPDGGEIAFSGQTDHGSAIFIQQDGKATAKQVTDDGSLASSPSWAPDGTQLAYARVTSPPPRETAPFYPPGCELDFARCHSDIFTISLTGEEEAALTHDPVGAIQPSWSPGGSRIAFVSGRNDTDGDIYVINSDGSGEQELTAGPAIDSLPSWSPDGTSIAFLRRVGHDPQRLFIMNADGSDQRAVSSATEWVSNFAWSPDGERLAYDLSVDTLPPDETNIYLVSPGGTDGTSIHVADPPGSLGSIAWQPLIRT